MANHTVLCIAEEPPAELYFSLTYANKTVLCMREDKKVISATSLADNLFDPPSRPIHSKGSDLEVILW